ncbi:ABC transporter substrate-binding protein [Salipiger sp. IMCC34102]|uniref:ABC transporter substrate-binding protein n=1 Tax=Salipiger sp. IMCC34102 TaxID=2510647 RepID=UPI0013EBE032|nr:ABC transporter substrate-binding protein [Salipiger sp. IMCC34102]
MKLKVNWFVPPPLSLISKARGFDQARGLEVLATVTTGSDAQFEALCAGEADAVVTAMDNVLMWNRRGRIEDIRIVAQIEAATGFILVARADAGRVEDLVGSDLLVDSAENGFAIALRALLHDAGIPAEAYRMIVVGGVRERFGAFKAGRGQATLLATFVEDAAVQAGFHTLARIDTLFPGMPGQGLAVRTGAMARAEPAIRAWLGAMDEARAWASENPGPARAIVEETGVPAPVVDTLLAGIPDSFQPRNAEIFQDQRRRLGLPGADGGIEMLVDDRLFRTLA